MSKRKAKPSLPPEVIAVIERARSGHQKRHHVVPRFYVQQWADDRNRVRVSDKKLGHSYLKKPSNVARVEDYYRLEPENLKDHSLPPLIAEEMLRMVESEAAPVLRMLASEDIETLTPEQLVALAWFIAVQLTRGERVRHEQGDIATWFFLAENSLLTPERLRRRFGEELTDTDVNDMLAFLDKVRRGAIGIGPDQNSAVGQLFELAAEVVHFLVRRTWVLADTDGPLITGDEPVVLLGAEMRPRGERSGVTTAKSIALPVTPGRALLMLHEVTAFDLKMLSADVSGKIYRDQLTRAETYQLSKEVAMNCSRWLFERPGTQIAHNLPIPTVKPGMDTEWIEVVDADGQHGEIIRNFPTTRWREIPEALWPKGFFWPTRPPRYPAKARYLYRDTFGAEIPEYLELGMEGLDRVRTASPESESSS